MCHSYALLGFVFCRLLQFAAGLQCPVTSCSTAAAVALVVQPRRDNNWEADINNNGKHWVHLDLTKHPLAWSPFNILTSSGDRIWRHMTPLAGARLGLPAGKAGRVRAFQVQRSVGASKRRGKDGWRRAAGRPRAPHHQDLHQWEQRQQGGDTLHGIPLSDTSCSSNR